MPTYAELQDDFVTRGKALLDAAGLDTADVSTLLINGALFKQLAAVNGIDIATGKPMEGGSASLASKYAIGEIADFVGKPSYYDAGDSQWMQTNTFVSASLLPANVKTEITALGPSYLRAGSDTDEQRKTLMPCAAPFGVVATVGSIQAIGAGLLNSYAPKLLVSDGTNTWITSPPITPGLYNNGCVASNGTTLVAVAANSASPYLKCATSTDGITWTPRTVTGLPNMGWSHTPWWPAAQTQTYGPCTKFGRYFAAFGASYGIGFMQWCGAQFLMIGFNSTNLIASRSTNGYTWSGDESTTVLGSASLAKPTDDTQHFFFHRNGNKAFFSFHLSPWCRYTTDGGVTWGTATTPPGVAGLAYTTNTTDPDKLIAVQYNAALGSYFHFTANCGQSWTSRTGVAPTTYGTAGIAYKGSTVIVGAEDGVAYRSTDDGATWTAVTYPVEATGLTKGIFADANRFYITLSTAQILTSIDGITWTVRTLPTAASGSSGSLYASDSNNVYLWDGINLFFTSDGGVTWSAAQINNTSSPGSRSGLLKLGASLVVGNGATNGSCISTGTIPQAYKSTTATVASLRTNATAYSRVA